MSWSNICSTVSISSQRHASRAQREARGWTWETKERESIWGSCLGCARTKGQLGNSFGCPDKKTATCLKFSPRKAGKRRGSLWGRKSRAARIMRSHGGMNNSGGAPCAAYGACVLTYSVTCSRSRRRLKHFRSLGDGTVRALQLTPRVKLPEEKLAKLDSFSKMYHYMILIFDSPLPPNRGSCESAHPACLSLWSAPALPSPTLIMSSKWCRYCAMPQLTTAGVY